MKKTKRVYRQSAYGRVKGEIVVAHGEVMDFGNGIRVKLSKGITSQAVKMSVEAPRHVSILRAEARDKRT